MTKNILVFILLVLASLSAFANDNFASLSASLRALTPNGTLPLKVRGSIADFPKFREFKAEEYRNDYKDDFSKEELAEYIEGKLSAITGVCEIEAQIKNKRDESQELRIDIKEIESDGTVGIRRDMRLNSQNNSVDWKFSQPKPTIDQIQGSAQAIIGRGTQTFQVERNQDSNTLRVIQSAQGPFRTRTTIFGCVIPASTVSIP